MEVREAYNRWAGQYDTNGNKTRDLEAGSLRETLEDFNFKQCLEIGCGTGKNTEWLALKSAEVTAVDLSEEMLAVAKQKIKSGNVEFQRFDITEPWAFTENRFDLITFSLVLEHIENLNDIFKKVSKATAPNAYLYIGELHPYKQYAGSKARFDTEEGQQVVNSFSHHLSDFTKSAKENGFQIESVNEYFDNNDRTKIPRILTLLFRKKDD